MSEDNIPTLNFPSLDYGKKETPWDLRRLLYKGGAAANSGKVADLIQSGELGILQRERLDLVQKLHCEMNSRLIGGGSRNTVETQIRALRLFFSWADERSLPLTTDSVQKTFLNWADGLLERIRVVKDVSEVSCYTRAAAVGNLITSSLDLYYPLIQFTRLPNPNRRKTARGIEAEKQNLEHTFVFGHMLQDICDGLPVEVVLKGELPINLRLRNGKNLTVKAYANASWNPEAIENRIAEGTLKTRHPLANLRIEAELMMFIGQTGINLGQAISLKATSFAYVDYLDGYQVRERKNRRRGEVIFEIFKSYRPHFERYLEWRRRLFPETELLFPFVRTMGARADAKMLGQRMRKICHDLQMDYVTASSLRNTRVNWLLRRSGDPDMAAEMAQHTKHVLLNVYERPSLQRAINEVTRFWAENDPHLLKTMPVAPGECDGQPQAISSIPEQVPPPDCLRASGCLWCQHHRDIDSLDYVWALASFARVKAIELSRRRLPPDSPTTAAADLALQRIRHKLSWFRESSASRRDWFEEANARIDEGAYHPQWTHVIASIEGAA
jgi:hypothetical protein